MNKNKNKNKNKNEKNLPEAWTHFDIASQQLNTALWKFVHAIRKLNQTYSWEKAIKNVPWVHDPNIQ